MKKRYKGKYDQRSFFSLVSFADQAKGQKEKFPFLFLILHNNNFPMYFYHDYPEYNSHVHKCSMFCSEWLCAFFAFARIRISCQVEAKPPNNIRTSRGITKAALDDNLISFPFSHCSALLAAYLLLLLFFPLSSWLTVDVIYCAQRGLDLSTSIHINYLVEFPLLLLFRPHKIMDWGSRSRRMTSGEGSPCKLMPSSSLRLLSWAAAKEWLCVQLNSPLVIEPFRTLSK